MNDSLDEIKKERFRQLAKWGVQRHSNVRWLTILVEEVGEAAQAILNQNTNLENELIQIAAVAVAWHEDIMAHEMEQEW